MMPGLPRGTGAESPSNSISTRALERAWCCLANLAKNLACHLEHGDGRMGKRGWNDAVLNAKQVKRFRARNSTPFLETELR